MSIKEAVIRIFVKVPENGKGKPPVTNPVNDEMGSEADWLKGQTPDRTAQEVPASLQTSTQKAK